MPNIQPHAPGLGAIPSRPVVCLAVLLAACLPAQDLLVTSRNGDNVLRFDATGKLLGVFATGGGLDNPVGLTFGPNGDLFVVSANTDNVLRYEGRTGRFLGVFASGGGQSSGRNLNFGPSGHLYVCSARTNQVLEYDGSTGRFLRVFASHPSLRGPTSLTFGPGGGLFVGSVLTNEVYEFAAGTGQFVRVFGRAGLNGPHDMAFGPDGRFYVSNAFGSENVVRLDGSTGALIDTFVRDPALGAPLGLSWDPRGDLLVVNQFGNEVRRYDGQTGAFKNVAAQRVSGGLDSPLFAAFVPGGPMTQLPPFPAGTGVTASFTVTGAAPGGLVLQAIGLRATSVSICPGQPLEIADPIVFGMRAADESGLAQLRVFVPAVVKGMTLRFQSLDATTCRLSTALVHRF